MNEGDEEQLNQRVGSLEKEISEIRRDLGKKQDRPDAVKKYISWIAAGILIVVFYSTYYFYIMSLF